MAKYCEDVFGELLLKQPLPECPVSWFSNNHNLFITVDILHLWSFIVFIRMTLRFSTTFKAGYY